MKTTFLSSIPVLPTSDVQRDVVWYHDKMGFTCHFSDAMYAVIYRENIVLHLQWHAGTQEDPLLEGFVVRILVKDIAPLFDEFVARGTVSPDRFIANTPWQTHEFGFYDLNNNALFFMEDIVS